MAAIELDDRLFDVTIQAPVYRESSVQIPERVTRTIEFVQLTPDLIDQVRVDRKNFGYASVSQSLMATTLPPAGEGSICGKISADEYRQFKIKLGLNPDAWSIVYDRPQDANDNSKIHILGHEVLHTLADEVAFHGCDQHTMYGSKHLKEAQNLAAKKGIESAEAEFDLAYEIIGGSYKITDARRLTASEKDQTKRLKIYEWVGRNLGDWAQKAFFDAEMDPATGEVTLK